MKNKKNLLMLLAVIMLLVPTSSFAGDALGDAATTIGDYFDGTQSLMFAIATLVGLIGGIRIFNKWNNGDKDINKEIIGWAGACVFIVLVPTFVQAIFP